MEKHCLQSLLLALIQVTVTKIRHQPKSRSFGIYSKKVNWECDNTQVRGTKKALIGTYAWVSSHRNIISLRGILDVQRWKEEFDLPDTTQYCIEVKMQNLNLSDGKPTKKVDAASAIVEIKLR